LERIGLVKTYALVAEAAEPDSKAPEGQPPGANQYNWLIMMVLVFGVFYLLVWRPQSKKRKDEEKKRQDMLTSLQKSAHVVTIGGIHGIVSSVSDDEVVLKIDEKADVRIRVDRSAITKVFGAEGEDEKKKGRGST
jgi:preprotein translocase subunit YajC